MLISQEKEKVLPRDGEGGKPEERVPQTAPLDRTQPHARLSEVDVVPVLTQADLSLLVVPAEAT